MERQADRQYSHLKDSFDWTVNLVGFLFAVATGLFFFFFGKTRKEIRDLVDEIVGKEGEALVIKDLQPFREKVARLGVEGNAFPQEVPSQNLDLF